MHQGALSTAVGILLGDREVLWLPGGAAHALAAHRVDRRLDRVGADDANVVRQLQARHRHPQPDQRHDQDIGVVGVARFGAERRQRGLEALTIQREPGGSLPERGEERGQHQIGAPGRVGGHGLTPLL